MNKIKLIMLLFLTVSNSLYCQTYDQDNNLLYHVLGKTHLKMGYYELLNGANKCQYGTLNIFNVDDTISVMLGGRLLMSGLGKDTIESKDRDCQGKQSSQYGENFAKSERVQICNINNKKEKAVYSVSLKPTINGLEYSRTTTVNDKEVLNIKCSLVLNQDYFND